jgi:hypothetical protein
VKVDPLLRVSRYVAVPPLLSDCWPWTGARTSHGYGATTLDGRYAVASRAAYELLIGPIPEGLVLDHLCRNRACVNPAHLEPVTHQVNINRGVGCPASRTHCPQGHPYDEANTMHSCGARRCRTCCRDQARAARARRKAAALALF